MVPMIHRGLFHGSSSLLDLEVEVSYSSRNTIYVCGIQGLKNGTPALHTYVDGTRPDKPIGPYLDIKHMSSLRVCIRTFRRAARTLWRTAITTIESFS